MSAEIKEENIKQNNDLLAKIKLLLRLETSDTTFDSEVNILISSAKNFLISAGVPEKIVNDATNEQVADTIGQYCKVKFGYSNQNNSSDLPESFFYHVNQMKWKI